MAMLRIWVIVPTKMWLFAARCYSIAVQKESPKHGKRITVMQISQLVQ